MPLALSALVLITASLCITIFGLWLVRRFLNVRAIKREEVVAGYLFNAILFVYAVILAFVVFAVWERYSTTQQSVTNEAAALVAAFRDTQILPEPARTDAQQALGNYAYFVMSREWASHGAVTQHRTPDPLNSVWRTYRELQPTTSQEESALSDAMDSLRSLEEQRHLRHLAGEASLPPIFWPLLISGGIITLGFSYFFVMRHFVTQALLTGLLTIVIIGVLFLIYSLNFPFTGQVQISRDPFRHALEQFKALNLK